MTTNRFGKKVRQGYEPKATGVLFGLLIVSIVTFLLNSWFVMLFLGWLHEDVASIPALGYSSSLILVALVTTLGAAWNSTVSTRLGLINRVS